MLTPEQLKEIPETFVQELQALEEFIIADIARRIAKEGGLTDTAVMQIEKALELGTDLEKIEKEIQRVTNAALRDIDSVIREAIENSLIADNEIYAAAGYDPVELTKSNTLMRLLEEGIRQTQGDFKNLTASMGFAVMQGGKITFQPLARFYQSALNQAALQVRTGVLNLNTAVRFAVKKMADSGLRYVDYASGHVNRVDVAVRRAVLTGVNQLNLRITDQIMQSLGAEYVETTAHMGARPEHQPWQGRVFHVGGAKDGYPDFVSSTGYGTGPGFGGWNCRHSYYPFFPGISERAYSDTYLDNIDPQPFTYEGKRYTYYEATQKQRQMETEIRKTKRELIGYDAAGMKAEFTEASLRLGRQKASYEAFSKAAGIRAKKERYQVLEYGKSISQKAVQTARREIEKYTKYRYNKDGSILVTDNWKERGKTSIPKNYKPYAVIETKTLYKNGMEQIDRTIYDANGKMKLQLHSGNHNRPKQHPYGNVGEHMHVYMWDEDKIIERITEELTDITRRWIGDLL